MIILLRSLLLLISLLIVIACSGNQIKELDAIVLEDEVGIERATEVELLYSDSILVRVAVHAPTLLRYISSDTPKQVFPDGIDADFYNTSHEQTSKLVANYAEQYQKERKVYLRDSVKIWNVKNEQLETDELLWDEAAEQISSTKFVRITTPTQIITGTGFKSNLEFTEWEIYQVSGIVESNNFAQSPF